MKDNEQTTSRQADIRLTDSVDNLKQYSPLFRKQVPDVFVHFVSGFLRRLRSIIGIEFRLDIPQNISIMDDSIWSIFPKLDYLIKRGIVAGYHESRGTFPDEPRPFGAQVNLAGVDSDQRVGMLGFGRSLFSQAEAWGPAFGEGIERWCSENFYPKQEDAQILTTEQIFKQTGLDLKKIPSMSRVSISDTKVDKGHSHHRHRIENDTPFVCVKTEELVSGKQQFVPLQFFSFEHCRRLVLKGKEPSIHPLVTTGSAAGRSLEEATLGAILEIIERDAFILYWLRKITPKRIDLNTLKNKELVAMIRDLEQRYHLEACFMHLPTDFPVHIVVCALIDRTGKGVAVTLDGSAHMDIEVAIEKTFTHTASYRGAVRRRYSTMGLDPFTIKPSELKLKSRAIWWYPPERLSELDFFIEGKEIACPAAYDAQSYGQQIEKLLSHCASKGYPVYRQNIIPPDIKKAIATDVVWVKIPQLSPLYLEEWERLEEGDRLSSIPKELGLEPRARLNTTPHPYS